MSWSFLTMPGRRSRCAPCCQVEARAGRWFEPGFGRPAGPSPDLAVVSSAEDAELWLRADVDNWLSALRSAAVSGQHSLVLDCAESMHWFSDRWPHASLWHEVFTLGSEAAAALGDLARQAAQLNYLHRASAAYARTT